MVLLLIVKCFMKPKTLLLTFLFMLLPGIAVLLQSCGCDEIVNYCHGIKGITVIPMDNSGAETTRIKHGEVIAKALLFELQFLDHIETCSVNGSDASSFAAPVFAFKRECWDDQYLDRIKDIKIFSTNDFDPAHPAGANLTALFKMPDTSDLNDFGRYSNSNWHDLYLMHEPANTGTHIFSFYIELINGATFITTCQPLKLLK